MPLATTFLAASLVVPSMPTPEYDDCEVVTNCVFDASRCDAKVFSVQIEFDATEQSCGSTKALPSLVIRKKSAGGLA